MTAVSAPTAAAPPPTSAATTTLNENFDTFLLLLTAQLQNQDPLDPVDSKEFTQQLVLFSQVEQQIRTNETLENLVSAQNAATTTAALSFIGREVGVIDDVTAITQDRPGQWQYLVPSGTTAATLIVRDSSGREVLRQSVDPSAGTKSFVWDGTLPNGQLAPVGAYQLSVSLTMQDKSVAEAEVRVQERVLGLDLDPQVGTSLVTQFGLRTLDQVFAVS